MCCFDDLYPHLEALSDPERASLLETMTAVAQTEGDLVRGIAMLVKVSLTQLFHRVSSKSTVSSTLQKSLASLPPLRRRQLRPLLLRALSSSTSRHYLSVSMCEKLPSAAG